jgi:alpha-1,3-glucosyltransferase
VLGRLFPLQRGLFEDKVANFWYTLSVLVDLRQSTSVQHLAILRQVKPPPPPYPHA